MTTRPPSMATRLLLACLPAGDRDEILGDLQEEFDARAAESGAVRARVWYVAQCARLIGGARRLRRAHLMDDGTAHGRALAELSGDVRLAVRAIRRSPGPAFIALLSMVVSVGIATAVFSIVTSVLLAPLPISTVDRVVRLSSQPERWQSSLGRAATIGGAPAPRPLTGSLMGAWLEQPGSLDAIATYNAYPQTVVIAQDHARVSVAQVGAMFFRVLPVVPVAGRTLETGDGAAEAARVAVVSERLLAERHLDRKGTVGTSLSIEGVPHEIVGVLPRDFAFPDLTVDAWVVDRARWPTPGERRQMNRMPLVLGLLRPGRTPADAAREGQHLADAVVAAGGTLSADGSTPRIAVTALADELLLPLRPALTLLVAGTIGVLIAANVTLAGFLLSRHGARRRDLAMRRALGASTWRLVRPIVVEQLILAGVAAVLALLLAALVIRVLPAVAPHDLPRLGAIAINVPSLAFAMATAIVTALVVGLLPARRLTAGALRAQLSYGGHAASGSAAGAERARRRLVAAQVGVATLLLVGAAFVGRTLLGMMQVDLGYQPSQVFTFQIGVPDPVTYGTEGRLARLYTELLTEIRRQPGVVSAGTSTALPLHGDTIRSSLVVPGLTPPRVEGQPWPTAHVENVDDAYLQTIGATLVAGRFFTPEDRQGAMKVAIVNELFARTFMPGVDPLGQIIPSGAHRYTVVGVIRPIQRAASTNPEDPAMYQSAAQTGERVAFASSRAMGVAVRTTGSFAPVLAAIRRVVSDLEPEAPVYNVMALDERVGRTFAQPRFFAIALALFATLALATASMGIYGVLSSVVEGRRVELGVRRALGATAGNVARLVMGEAARLTVIGLVAGSVAAGLAAVVGQSVLYGASPVDAPAYVAASVVVVGAVLLGAWIPMRAATRVDPARVLRAD